MTGRPLDVMEESLGGEVRVHLKSGETYHGELGGYDQHMNLVLEPTDDEPTEPDDPGPTRIGVTTIIRGDNVVTIQP
jgi:small nuclear ribonucleoprotein (snRNP)-like protein